MSHIHWEAFTDTLGRDRAKSRKLTREESFLTFLSEISSGGVVLALLYGAWKSSFVHHHHELQVSNKFLSASSAIFVSCWLALMVVKDVGWFSW